MLSIYYTVFMESRQQPDDIWSQFALSIFRLNGLLMLAGEGISAPVGQSSARWQVLGRVAFESRTVAEMARDMGHARQSVQRIADVLVKEGLVAYQDHPTDKRTKLLEITPQGMDVLKAIYARQLEWSERIMSQLNPEQLAGITRALENLGQVLESELNVSSETKHDEGE